MRGTIRAFGLADSPLTRSLRFDLSPQAAIAFTHLFIGGRHVPSLSPRKRGEGEGKLMAQREVAQAQDAMLNGEIKGSARSIDRKTQDKQDHENNKECVEQCSRNVSRYAKAVSDSR